MNNFFYNSKFYSDIEEMMIDLEIDEETIEDQPDSFICYKSSHEPILKLNADWIIDRIDEERFTEEGREIEKLEKLLKEIDFSIFNDQCPKLFYATRQKFEITKADLYETL